MTQKDTGGPAFPAPYDGHGCGPNGMTLRDWFAGQSLSNINPVDVQIAAELCYQIADAMLAEREK